MTAVVGAVLFAVGVSAAPQATAASHFPMPPQATAAPDSQPKWLTALIRDLERNPIANPPAVIARYRYRGDTVYYLPPRCCDIPSNVYNAAGAIICHADGGMDGNGDGRCDDFYAARKDEKIIWRDRRRGR